jgi:hypothetical protein
MSTKTKIKNKTYQPLPLLVNGNTILVPGRKTFEVDVVTPQMISLKTRGLIQIIKSN